MRTSAFKDIRLVWVVWRDRGMGKVERVFVIEIEERIDGHETWMTLVAERIGPRLRVGEVLNVTEFHGVHLEEHGYEEEYLRIESNGRILELCLGLLR